MSKIPLSKALNNSGIPHEIPWASQVIITLPDDYLPFDHQYQGVNLLAVHDRGGLFDEAGTGKTLAMQMNALWRVGEGNKVLVLMPPVLLKQFYEELHSKFVNVGQFVRTEIFRGTVAQRQKLIMRYAEEGWPDILLMTYELFRGNKPRRVKNPEGGKAKIVRNEGYHVVTKAQGYDVIIADEAQALNNSQSRVHKKVYSYIGGKQTDPPECALVLATATPSHTRAEQCYGLIRLLNPTAYGTKAEFERLHIEYDQNVPYKKIADYLNLDILHMNLYAHARRVEKSDVAPDMPDKISTLVPIELDPKHKALYKKLLNERMLELEDKFIDAVDASALRQIAMQLITNPGKYSDTPIRNTLDEWLDMQLDAIQLETTKAMVVIHYNETARRLAKHLEKYNPVVLNGETKDKDKAKESFLTDDKCRVLIVHSRSGGAGSNFQSVCNNVLFYECPDSPGDITQVGDRVHRIVGTDSTVNLYFASAIGTWAAKKIRQVVEKAAYINEVVGDKKALMADLFDEDF